MQIDQVSQTTQLLCLVALLAVSSLIPGALARRDWGRGSAEERDDPYSAVIPSPNQEFGYPDDQADIMRRTEPSGQATTTTLSALPVPVYASQYPRVEQSAARHQEPAQRHPVAASEHPDESSNLEDEASAVGPEDLKVAASYGHGHGHHKHHGSKGWLEMGAYSGPKGAFGWHAKYPVGGKKHGY